MPARKQRKGAALANWEARKERAVAATTSARSRVRAASDHALLRPLEAAAMLGVTPKTLRELEARGQLPPRVSFSSKVFGWRLGDMETLIRAKMEAGS